MTLLIMFPQLVETLYSPALPDIALTFSVSTEQAAQTLSVYFVAFAAGVALWGYLSDRIGRRPAAFYGLICYGTGALLAVATADFQILMLARMISALGAASGSVVVQTMLRDGYASTALARVFSIMGAALSISPVLGLLSGGWLVSHWGHKGVFILLLLLAILLLTLTALLLPETRPASITRPRLGPLTARMLRDGHLWRDALLIALFNAMLFSYYSLAPFLFEQLGWSANAFGWTGLLLALASLVGSLLNKKRLASGITPTQSVRDACHLALLLGHCRRPFGC
ncbi:MFS transporter [Zymobacter sp. IVIA_12111.31 C1]|uniref:MFS transporter n=1 Tax=Zymobacter sp. IVIA_12111.31 C1 TaxID=3394854 RepID=UPI0039C33A97